jgi:hypothetical protein
VPFRGFLVAVVEVGHGELLPDCGAGRGVSRNSGPYQADEPGTKPLVEACFPCRGTPRADELRSSSSLPPPLVREDRAPDVGPDVAYASMVGPGIYAASTPLSALSVPR